MYGVCILRAILRMYVYKLRIQREVFFQGTQQRLSVVASLKRHNPGPLLDCPSGTIILFISVQAKVQG